MAPSISVATPAAAPVEETPKVLKSAPVLNLKGEPKALLDPIPEKYSHILDEPIYGDWRDQLVTDGYYVVKGAIPKERALAYREKAFEWMTSKSHGFVRDDPETWNDEHLPANFKGGMIHGYAVHHEQWVWDIRTEPGVTGAFAKVWGTDELVTSFDSVCVMMPNRKDVTGEKSWEHMDQSQRRVGFFCVQGIANLNENGPEDGGLLVLKGSAQLMKAYFDEIGREEDRTWGPVDWYGFTKDQLEWFYARGCEWVKVCGEPGDLYLWDSRAIHYNCTPTGTRDRTATYVCMAPRDLLSESDKQLRIDAFNNFRRTTHVPFAYIYSTKEQVTRKDGSLDELDTGVPTNPVERTDVVLKLAGLKEY